MIVNNDILRRIRYTFDFNDAKMIELFALADHVVTREQVSNWLKKGDAPQFQEIKDIEFSLFLNGLINHNRGKREGEQPPPELKLTNNIILKKLKIALSLQSEDIQDIFLSVGRNISKHELSAFLRNPKHRQYKPFQDQFMRNFMYGLQLKYRKEK